MELIIYLVVFVASYAATMGIGMRLMWKWWEREDRKRERLLNQKRAGEGRRPV